MSDNSQSERIRNPFTSREREFLRSLSGYAKDNDLLTGYQRKVLYEGGHYNYVFVGRLAKVNDALADMHDALTSDDAQYAHEIRMKGYRIFLKKQAEVGNAEIQSLLGDCYRLGIYGLDQDDEAASYWYRQSSEQGDGLAKMRLAEQLLDDGEGDVDEAIDLLRTSIDAGNYEAATILGLCFLEGEHVEQDIGSGLKYLHLAAENDDDDAQYELGFLYCKGEHVKQDFKKAMSFFELSAEKNNYRALFEIGFCYDNGQGVEEDEFKAFAYYEKASENGSAVADYFIGMQRFTGIGCKEDHGLAFESFCEALNNNIEEAHIWLGTCYLHGSGTPPNYEMANHHFEAAAGFDPRAELTLGDMKRSGKGCEVNYKAAFRHYLSAAEDGDDEAMMAVGRAFYYGEGVDEDGLEAVKWLSLAAEEKEDEALYLLGDCYIQGFGVDADEKRGIELTKEAAEQGNEDALERLSELGHAPPQDRSQVNNVHDLGGDLTTLARIAYQKTMQQRQRGVHKTNNSNVVNFSTDHVDTIENAMREIDDTV